MTQRYIYMGDKFTSPEWKGKICTLPRRTDGKCIRGRNGNMLADFDGKKIVILGRRLRKLRQ